MPRRKFKFTEDRYFWKIVILLVAGLAFLLISLYAEMSAP